MEQTIKKIVCKNDLFFKDVEEILKEGKRVKITVRGDSMNPVLKDGDIVVLEKGHLPNEKKGDIVFAKHEGKYILHRVMWMSANTLCLAGDGNKLQVEKVRKDHVLAVVSGAFRGEEYLSLDFSGSSVQWFGRCLSGFFWYIGNRIKKRYL
ncbi:S24 family peptidase [Sphingobacterium faecale]|uniref:Peptidase S24/S26A/S26B/S26C domain-containing protein n=1 Tax=Sphingobacterium faecale TaxID=2803775 RepID=A0ABS1R055_9SPHI|nr:S24 family peptidase [Sphingobacterium faecale]MBL1407276.1 hypothetical protein [Sphingobacterium faecale]